MRAPIFGLVALILITLVPSTFSPQARAGDSVYTISTVAGNGERGFAGDGGPATKAKLNRPCAVAVGPEGDLFIADYSNHRIRKVARDGTISTLAGTGEAGFGGDGGPAIQAKLHGPYGVKTDKHGNVYVADQQNNRVRKITKDGVITTVAGNGKRAFAGDGGPATEASLIGPDDMLVDDAGNLIIADSGNHRIRKVTADGIISTVAGTGKPSDKSESTYSGDGGPAVKARLHLPAALALDSAGNLYVGDFLNHVVRKIATDGTITTLAGVGKRGFDDDGRPATKTRINEPGGVAVDRDGCLIFADGVNYRVRRVDPDGIVHTIAGTGVRGYGGDGGPAVKAQLSVLDAVVLDPQGNIYVADHTNNRIRKLMPADAPRP
jgi:sugar lactone lactonase YvrE